MGINLYGVIIALAVLAGTGLTAREFRKNGLDGSMVIDALPWVLVFGVIGARSYHVAHYWSYYSVDLVRVLAVWKGGLGIYGGLAGGIIGLIVFLCWRLRLDLKSTAALPFGRYLKGWFSGRSLDAQHTPTSALKGNNDISAPARLTFKVLAFRRQVSNELWTWLNLMAPGVVLGQAIGRVGNIVNHELLPFAGYEMVWDLVVFGLLVHGIKLERRFSGYLFLYAFGRFFLEFLRTDNIWRIGVLTVAQAISLVIVAITLFLVLLRRRPFYPLADECK